MIAVSVRRAGCAFVLLSGCAKSSAPPALATGTAHVVDLRCDAATEVKITAPSTSRVVLHVTELTGAMRTFSAAACKDNGACTRSWPLVEELETEEAFVGGPFTTLRFDPGPGCAPSRITLEYGWKIID